MVLNMEIGPEKPTPPRNPHEAAERTKVISGSAENVAREVRDVSPEGTPGDPKAGPATIRSERYIAVLLVIIAVAASSIWVGWIAAVIALVVGGMALLFNPVMAAAGQRAEDRAEVIERRGSGGPHPGAPVV